MRKFCILAFLLAVLIAKNAIAQSDPSPSYVLPDLKPGLTSYNGKYFNLRLSFAIIYDYSFFDQDQNSLAQVGEQEDQEDLRGGRYVFTTQIKFRKPWLIFLAGDFNEHREQGDQIFEGIDRYLMIPLWGDTKVSIGKQKESFVYEMVGDAANLPQQERILSPFFKSRNVGIKFSGTAANKNMTWSAGWFNDWFNQDIPFDESGNEFTGRVTGLPLMTEDGSTYLHVGFAARYVGATQGKLRFRGRPESNITDNYVNTGDIPSDSASEIAFEGLYNSGPFSVLAEVVPGLWVDSPETKNPHFFGYYLTGSWCITGENRPYDKNVGYARRIIPKGRMGAWEAVARYSYLDLTDQDIDGGRLNKWYFGLNWWASRQWKLGVGYGLADLNKAGLKGRTNSLILRVQWVY